MSAAGRGAPRGKARGRIEGRGPGSGREDGAAGPLSALAGARGADLSAARAASGAAFVRSSESPLDGEVVGSRRGKPGRPARPGPARCRPPLAFAPFPPLSGPLSSPRPAPPPPLPPSSPPPSPSFPSSHSAVPAPVSRSSLGAVPPPPHWGSLPGASSVTHGGSAPTSPHRPGRGEPPARVVASPAGRTVFSRACSAPRESGAELRERPRCGSLPELWRGAAGRGVDRVGVRAGWRLGPIAALVASQGAPRRCHRRVGAPVAPSIALSPG